MSDIGKRVRERRKDLGWSLAELGRRIGISKEAVGKIERGDTKAPTAEHLAALATTLKCSWEWLLHGQENHQADQPTMGDVRSGRTGFVRESDAEYGELADLLEWLTDDERKELIASLRRKKSERLRAIEVLRKREGKD